MLPCLRSYGEACGKSLRSCKNFVKTGGSRLPHTTVPSPYRDLYRLAANPSYSQLHIGRTGSQLARYVNVDPIGVAQPRPSDAVDHLRRLAVDRHLYG